ncbi:alpha-keto acid decarboxylase family protein, partial [Bacillus sp. BB081]
YNDIPRWQYTKLIEAFGGDAYTMQVHTNQELDQAIQEAEQQQNQKLCLIELMIADPMDAPKYLRKTREFLQKQEQQQ